MHLKKQNGGVGKKKKNIFFLHCFHWHPNNHPLIAADTLNKRDVGNDVKAKLAEMFGNGHSPSSALSAHKLDLHFVHGDQYPFIAADRALCPDLQFCYRYDLIAGC